MGIVSIVGEGSPYSQYILLHILGGLVNHIMHPIRFGQAQVQRLRQEKLMSYNKSMHGVVEKTGTENPSNSERTSVIGSSKRGGFRSVAGGSLSRALPSNSESGNSDLDFDQAGARYEMTPVRGGSKDEGKQTWKGARSGYETREIPGGRQASPADCSYQDDEKYGKNENKGPSGHSFRTERPEYQPIKHGGGSRKQNVKDNLGLARRGEAKQVAGISK